MDTFELPPPAELIDKEVVFGLVTGENRGDNASTTLRFFKCLCQGFECESINCAKKLFRYLNDPYFWMRHISDPKVYLRLQEEVIDDISAYARSF
jgi:hypothetical protein